MNLTTRLLGPLLVLAGLTVACAPPDLPPVSTSSTTSSTTTSSTTTSLPPTEPTADQRSAAAAAQWLLTQFEADGHMPFAGAPTVYDAGNAVLAITDLAALGVGDDSLAVRLDEFEEHMEDYIDQGAGDRAGALARVIMLAVAVGEDPRSFGGSDLVARLEATQQASGLYGAQHAGFDGSFRQGLALAALSLVTPPPASITPGPGQHIQDVAGVAWLIDQQCSDGSWMMFRASTTGPCVENPAMWVFKDSNGSALATLGLSAVGADADVDPSLWFDAVRGDDGGWGTGPAGAATESDADSTGLVIAALESLDDPPAESAYEALRSFQMGDSAPVVDRGSFTWLRSNVAPNRLSTLDAMAALFDRTWPAALAG